MAILSASKIENFFANIEKKLSEEFDFDFSVGERKINNMEEFNVYIKQPFLDVNTKCFYRGERIKDKNRPLISTMIRNYNQLYSNGNNGITNITIDDVYNIYNSNGKFIEFFNKTMGKADVNNMYQICAFAQHYFQQSPLIDFTKSIYPALSFALKGRSEFDNDIVLYTVELEKESDYTTNMKVANEWLKDLDVTIVSLKKENIEDIIKQSLKYNKKSLPPELDHINKLTKPASPTAKLIDIPTNDLMKFQQGVFLLLSDFKMTQNSYLTKNIRKHFIFNKYVIDKDVCPKLVEMINTDAPWYNYDVITDVKKAFTVFDNNN